MAATAYRHSTVPELASLLASGQASAQELAVEALTLLAGVGCRHNAVATLLPDRATREAGRADRRRVLAASPLLGIPYGAKDLFAARGGPTTWGVPAYADRIIDWDATAIGRLSRAGSVLVAKLATVELAGGGGPRLAGASLQGQPHNPWDPARYSGGSSSGSGIAVAAGLVPFALGTETIESVMMPAAYCGVTGLRPTFGRVPRSGVMTLSWTLDKVGVLAHTAEDCAIVLSAISGPDGGDPDASGRFRWPSRTANSRPLGIGISEDETSSVDPTIRAALEEAVGVLRASGHRIGPAELPRNLPYRQAIERLMCGEAAVAFRAELERADFRLVDERQLATLRAALSQPSREYIEALRVRAETRQAFARLFRSVDVLVSASFPTTAPRLDVPREPRGARGVSERLMAAANLVGLPGLSVPCGLATDGLPVGLHLVGPARSEGRLVALAMGYQTATAHHRLRPGS